MAAFRETRIVEALAVVLLSVLAFAFLAWAHHAFWREFLAPKDRPDEIHRVRTQDGWNLGVRRYRPRGAGQRYEEPVILCHGLGANHYNLDWDPPYGLAQALAEAGRDCWVISLRGHEGSDRPALFNELRWGFSFDDYLHFDVPAVLDYVLERTGVRRVQWVGHSMGGILAYALGGSVHERKLAGGLVAVGSPSSYSHQIYLRRLARLGAILAGRRRVPQRWITHMLAPFTGHFDPPFSELVVSPKSTDGGVIRRLQANAFEDISAGVARQFDDWVSNDCFRSLDKKTNYHDAMRAFSAPVLLIGGSKDMMAPPACMRGGLEKLGSEDKTLVLVGREFGSQSEYGHGDLIFGRNAPREVFPLIERWLAAHATPAGEGTATG